MNITYHKVEVGSAYPRNGNLHNPTKRYRWEVRADGRLIGSASTLKAVKEIAALYLSDH